MSSKKTYKELYQEAYFMLSQLIESFDEMNEGLLDSQESYRVGKTVAEVESFLKENKNRA